MIERRQHLRKRQFHGLSRHPLYHLWSGMMTRCYNPRCRSFKDYGGRGIAVCERWHDVRLFVEDIERLIGPKPTERSLDRINNEGHYKPGNVRWATAVEQGNNRRMYTGPKISPPDRSTVAEDWRPVPGYEGWYEASDQGAVYALARPFTHGGLLKPQLNSAGYRTVRLSKYGRVRTRTIGSLVLLTFRGPPPPGTRARHGAGGRLDDRLENLRWG